MSILITPEWPYCAYPLIAEVYNICTFNCLYCFTKHKETWHNKAKKRAIRSFDINRDIINNSIFEKIFTGSNITTLKEIELAQYLSKRLAIQIGGQTDPCSSLEIKYKQTYRLLHTLKTLGKKYPVRISTKGTLFKNKEYLNILKDYNTASVLITIISTDDHTIKKIEQGTPTITSRFKLAKILSEHNITTGLRLRPIIPRFTELTLENLLEQASNNGFKWITTEWLRIPRTMTKLSASKYSELSELLGYDVCEYYKYHSDYYDNRNGFLRLKEKYTIQLYRKIISLSRKMGLKLASCNKDYRCVDTYSPNCCGVPLSDNSWNRMQISYAVYLARENGKVSLSDFIDYDSPLFSIKNKYTKHKCTYGETLINIWNDNSHRYYPANFFAELAFSYIDSEGNHVFTYNKKG